MSNLKNIAGASPLTPQSHRYPNCYDLRGFGGSMAPGDHVSSSADAEAILVLVYGGYGPVDPLIFTPKQ